MRCILYLLLFIPAMAFSQAIDQNALDTLDYEPLLTLYNKHDGDSITQEKIARTYLRKARRDKDTIKMARAYDRLSTVFESNIGLKFADSVIVLTKNLNHFTYPAQGYMLKALILQRLDNHNKALENYIKGYRKALNTENVIQQLYLLSIFSFYASTWGNNNLSQKISEISESILNHKNFKNNFKKFYRDPNPSDSTIVKDINYHLADLYIDRTIISINSRRLDSAKNYSNKVIKMLPNLQPFYVSGFKSIAKEGIVEVEFYSKRYLRCLEKIEELLADNDLVQSIDIENIYFFKGLSLIALNEEEKGISYLLKTDSIATPNSVLPYRMIMYDTLINYFERENNFKKANYYLKRKVSIDSVFKENYKKVNLAVLEEVLNPITFQEKDDTIIQLETEKQRSNLLIWILLGIAVIILSAALYYFNRQRQFAKRFIALQAAQQNDTALNKINKQDRELSATVVQTIFKYLESFEAKKGFLDVKVSLNNLAKQFGTNANYLSRVINLKKEKSFSNYINELRINYALQQLQEDPKFIKYTIKAIAGECGYANADSFSRAFYKQTGMYPSFYIKKLQEEK